MMYQSKNKKSHVHTGQMTTWQKMYAQIVKASLRK